MTLVHLFAGYCLAVVIMMIAYQVVVHVGAFAWLALDNLWRRR